MEAVLSIWNVVVAGGPTAIIAILFVIVVYLGYERYLTNKLIANYQKIIEENRSHYSDSIVELIDRYHDGNVELMKALNEIKLVLATMQKTIL